MADIFLSYASEDRARVAPLVELLEQEGFSVWWDRRIGLGASFDREIEQALDSSLCVVVVWTVAAVNSDWVRAEAQEGLDREVLVPILLDDIAVPLGFRRIQAANLINWRGTTEELVNVFDAVAAHVAHAASAAPTNSNPTQVAVTSQSEGRTRQVSQKQSKQLLAVLPVRNLTGDTSFDWFVDGLAEQLNMQIDAVPGIEVLPNMLVASWPAGEFPEDLDLVLDGYLDFDGSDLQAVISLIDTNSRSKTWHRVFSGPSDKPRELQRQISAGIARYLGESSTGPFPPERESAYKPYLRWLARRTFDDPDEELDLLQATLDADPAWSAGWAELAIRYHRCAVFLHDPDYIGRAEDAIRLARETHTPGTPRWWRGQDAVLQTYVRGDLHEGESWFSRGASTGNGFYYVRLMAISGLWDEALAWLESSVQEHPWQPWLWEFLILTYKALGKYAEASEASHRLDRLAPGAFHRPSLSDSAVRAGLDGDKRKIIADEYEKKLNRAKPGSQSEIYIRWLYGVVFFEIALEEGDLPRASAIAREMADIKLYALAGILYLRMNAPEGSRYLELAAQNPEFVRLWWLHFLSVATEEVRAHPSVVALQDALGYTDHHRYWLAQQTSKLPRESGIYCNPEKYRL